jgi:hypothetical protein
VGEVTDWNLGLLDNDPEIAESVAAAINLLEIHGPSRGRPTVDRISHSSVHNLKELRPGSRGSSEIRILFVFDPARQAVLLVAGDKAGAWDAWYRKSTPHAEQRYTIWLAGGYDEVRGA